MAFNIVAKNQDDHVKNIAFLMNKQGQWKLSPAYDVTYNYNPTGHWASSHQMSINGKQDGFTLRDFEQCAKSALMKRGRAKTILNEVSQTVSQWPRFAKEAELSPRKIQQIQQSHRLNIC